MYNNNIISTSLGQVEKTVKVEKTENYKPSVVKAELQGNFIEVKEMYITPKPNIKKLNKYEYLDLSTGEIKEFNYSDNKTAESLRITFAKLKGLIRTNFSEEANNQLFITLTYGENMQDEKKLYSDFDLFYKNLKYRYKDKYEFDYIVVAEPQERGAWHLHLMLKTKNDNDILYIDNRVISEIWGKGWTDTQKLKSDDVGTYYVAYFTDLIDESKKPIEEMNAEEKKKARVKGSRLHYYPKNFKFYRTSRGIKKPTVVENVNLNELEADYQKLNEYAYNVVDVNTEKVLNSGYKATFKKNNRKYSKAKVDEYGKP